MPTPNPAAATVPAISDAQRIEIARGAEREKRFAFARKLASFNGVGAGIFALIALLSAVLDPSSLLLALPLAAIAFVELNGGQRVARYERNGLVQLACNQLALIALVSIYALVQIFNALDGGSPVNELLAQSGMAPADLDLSAVSAEIGDFDAMYRTAVTAFYGVVIAATALAQGGCALLLLLAPQAPRPLPRRDPALGGRAPAQRRTLVATEDRDEHVHHVDLDPTWPLLRGR